MPMMGTPQQGTLVLAPLRPCLTALPPAFWDQPSVGRPRFRVCFWLREQHPGREEHST